MDADVDKWMRLFREHDEAERRAVVRRLQMGMRRAAQRRLDAGEGRPGDVAWAGRDSAATNE